MTTTYSLPAWHVQVLEWFEANAGRTFAKRPIDVGLGVKVSQNQKGIWKPSNTEYAISVVQTHKGVYEDLDPIDNGDSTWTYFYHQEGKSDEELRDPSKLYANRALFRCISDGVPVGVIIPAESGRGYQVLGLAEVVGWKAGHFELLGPVSVGAERVAEMGRETAALVNISLLADETDSFDPNGSNDSRIKVIRSVHRRQGAPRFRKALLTAYRQKCAMTRYDAKEALEAAHIIPYRGPQTNHIANGLLLRADMHDLFDLGLIAVDTSSMRLLLADDLSGTMYESYADQPIWVPRELEARPSVEALDMHRAQSAVA